MRISDWSSDVCSSDLCRAAAATATGGIAAIVVIAAATVAIGATVVIAAAIAVSGAAIAATASPVRPKAKRNERSHDSPPVLPPAQDLPVLDRKRFAWGNRGSLRVDAGCLRTNK